MAEVSEPYLRINASFGRGNRHFLEFGLFGNHCRSISTSRVHGYVYLFAINSLIMIGLWAMPISILLRKTV